MRRALLVPKLGLTMAEGTLVEWMVRPGQRFGAGDSLFVVESEKAATEIPAEADGVLLEAAVDTGTTLAVGSLIGYWDDDPAAAAAPAAPAAPETPAAPHAAPAPMPSAPPGAAAPPAEPQPIPAQDAAPRLRATPLARRLARERGIDLATVQGSGPRGRIRAADLPAAATPTPAPAPTTPALVSAAGTLRPATAIEQTVARRLVAAKQEIPHFYLSLEAEVSALQALRGELNATGPAQRFTLNHFILAAVGRALARMPEVNRVWTADGILHLAGSDVGMAVDTPRGLLVPVLREAGTRPLPQIARDAQEAAARAQAGRLGAADMAGGAITVSNAGMHGVTYMASIINPGQSMILGVGSVRGLFRPDEEGRPALRREMGLVLSADHRVLDGVTALGFLQQVVAGLERPLGLLVA